MAQQCKRPVRGSFLAFKAQRFPSKMSIAPSSQPLTAQLVDSTQASWQAAEVLSDLVSHRATPIFPASFHIGPRHWAAPRGELFAGFYIQQLPMFSDGSWCSSSRDMRLERPLNCSLFTCMGFVLRFLQAFELSECRYLYPLQTCLNTTKSTPRRAMINHHPQEAHYRPRSILVAATRSRIACPMPIRKKP